MHLFRNLLGIAVLFSFNQVQSQNNFDLIPLPTSVVQQNGIYQLPTQLSVLSHPDFKEAAQLLKEYPGVQINDIQTQSKGKKINIIIQKPEKNDDLDPKAYSLNITKDGIILKALETPQIINGIYTLVQLGYLQKNPLQLSHAKIVDEPRFNYRGLHLDVSRHFVPVSFVKKYIDIMAIYKFNNLHWHITDGAGWRLEIKKYPKLTQKAAWRTHTTWKDWWNNGRQYLDQGTPNASGGFYTQEEVKDLVKYAENKGINIIPEIEIPGHSEEVLAVYPELSCSGVPYTQSEFCIGNEKTFDFLKNVIDEVIAIFPSKYIHIGGDEADKKHWKTCPKDQALMQKEGLKNVDELQSYAVHQMDKYLQSKGRKLIGWDEILDGGLSAGATVMSWRGEEGGIKAANAGHDVIMTPGSHLYFDQYQTDPRTEPEAIGGFLPLEKVYSYNPIPEAISEDKKHHILGAQANIWAEYVPTTSHLEYMVFPRALALSEVNWTQKEMKDWKNFRTRLQSHYKLLQDLQVNYYRPSYNVGYHSVFNTSEKSHLVTLETEQLDISKIRYTLDGSTPTSESLVYTQPFKITKPTAVKAAYFLGNTRIGPELAFNIDIHKAIGKKVIYNNPWDSYAAQREKTLTNGEFGGLSYHDQQWQGFTKALDVTLDFEKQEDISSVAMNFMQLTGPGVYMPGEMEVYVSNDNINFTKIGVNENTLSDQEHQLTFRRFEVKLDSPQKTRYLRIKASNPKRGYLFTDEIIVY